jgi:hypothetical protein
MRHATHRCCVPPGPYAGKLLPALCVGGCLAVVAIGTAAASDVGVAPRRLLMVERAASTRRSKTIFVAKDTAVVTGPASDVEQVYARVHVRYGNGADVGTFVIPAGTANGWVRNDGAVTKYRNRHAPRRPTQVRTILLRRGRLVKVRARGRGDAPLGLVAAGPPGGSVYVSVELVEAGITTRLCSELTECRYRSIDGATGAKLTCRGGVPDPKCRWAPPDYLCGQDVSYGGPGTVAVIGDSITHQAKAALEAALGDHWFLHVEAKPGAMFRELQEAAETIGRTAPQVVVIHLGTNDDGCILENAWPDLECRYPDFGVDDLLADARAMVASVAGACILGTSPWWDTGHRVDDLWREMVATGELAGVVPWSEYLASLPDDERALLLADGMGHLTAAGRVALAELTADVVDQARPSP